VLSGGGVNFAPWDTAYADIYKSGRYDFLAWPENGSAAEGYMANVSGLLGNKYYGTVTAPQTPGLTGTLPDAIHWYGEVANAVIPVLTTRARGIGAAARRSY
jgi:branched-subunit amino acid aminotransferase/4-amino-4-deoxychorismate lyase